MKKQRLLILLAAVLIAMVFTGCDFAIGGEYEMTIVNQTTGYYNYFDVLNVTDSGQDTWGKSYASNSDYIHEDKTYVIKVSPISTPESVDIRVQCTLLGTELRQERGDKLDLTKTIYIRDSGITN
jgi:hypothetical protein